MKKQFLIVGALACALCLPMVGCGGSGTPATNNSGDDAKQEQPAEKNDADDKDADDKDADAGDFDAVTAYAGQWRGSVKTTGMTVYGNAGGTEQMLDVMLNADGTCEVVPMEAHADLLTDEGTWDGTESEITLHLSDGDITITVIDGVTAEANPADFGIDGFDVLNLDFFG